MTHLKEGDVAPKFSLQDQDGKTHKLSDYKGRRVLLYFYPKDNTPGCINEACAIRDTYTTYKKEDIVVFGVSADTTESHKKFANKYKLPFALLADPEKEVVKEYGVYGKKKFLGKSYMGISRESFLINEEGIIAKVYKDVKPKIHAQEVLQDVKL